MTQLDDLSKTESNAWPLSRAMLRGALGFAAVSVVSFGVWAFGGKWLEPDFGEAGLFAACAIAFVALSGLLLHPLVRGPRSLARFYRIFIPAYLAYAIVWCASWFALRFGLGEWLASLTGSIVLTLMIGRGLRNLRGALLVMIVMFALHSAGYFFGGHAMYSLLAATRHGPRNREMAALAKLCWGLLYGLGVGAGLGYAFHTFQINGNISGSLTESRRGFDASRGGSYSRGHEPISE